MIDRAPRDLIWISGASTGIGAALASTVPLPDAQVVDISRSGGAGGTEHLPADLTDPLAWAAVEEHFVARVGAASGGTAVFVHNAGTIEPIGFAGAVDSAAYRAEALLNAAAPLALGHAFLRAVAQFEGEAHLYMLSSGAASRPYPGWSGYCAGKAAVEMWVRTAGEEQRLRARRGEPSCRVIAVAPGVVATGMQEQVRDTSADDFPAVGKFRDLYDHGELTDPGDAARGIWSLLDRELETGTVLDLRHL
jgi:benzil reductase ((S)-benzoin forming)